MIVVKIEMWPGGDESAAYEFGRAHIINHVDTTEKTRGSKGDYSIQLWGGVSQRKSVPPTFGQPWRRGVVLNFDRRLKGAWHLLFLGLRECLRLEVVREYLRSDNPQIRKSNR